MKYLILLLLVVAILSCENKTETKESPVSFELKTLRLESPGGCKADTLPCAYYEVIYPEFSGMDSSVTKIVKRQIDASVSMDNPEAEGQSMKEIGEGFVEDYEDFKNEIPAAFGGWHYTAKVNVEVLTDSLLSISVNEEFYTGGAHGGSGVYFINLNPKTGKEFTLKNLLKPGYEEQLTTIGNNVFREAHQLADTASLNENYYEFPEDKFELNKNYGFKKEGIVFFFNSYEIAPYAAGPSEVLIPYEKIQELIKE